MEKVRISAVSYLNTKPFLYGIEQSGLESECEVQIDHPSICAQKLIDDEVDLALVPVTILPELDEYHILTNYGIGCDGPVGSVMLLSQCPLDQIETILLDHQSKTSVLLTRLLAEKHWNIKVDFIEGKPGFQNQIKDRTAGVMIGDRIFSFAHRFKYKFDLGQAWKDHTGLAFVFACWVANKELPSNFEAKLDSALDLGLKKRAEVVRLWQPEYPGIDVDDYLNNSICYELKQQSKEGLARFLHEAKEFYPTNAIELID